MQRRIQNTFKFKKLTITDQEGVVDIWHCSILSLPCPKHACSMRDSCVLPGSLVRPTLHACPVRDSSMFFSWLSQPWSARPPAMAYACYQHALQLPFTPPSWCTLRAVGLLSFPLLLLAAGPQLLHSVTSPGPEQTLD